MPREMRPERRYLDATFLQLPLATQEGLARYIEERLPGGHFLTAVLSNDLREAVNRADQDNLAALGSIVQWLFWHAPSKCWGNPENVRDWLAREEA
jgi:hypothetical protein